MMARTRAFARSNDAAAATVVGAILVTAALFASFAFFRLTVVPTWEQQVEADHMGLVERGLIGLKSEADRQVDNRTTVPVAHPIALRPQTSNVFVSQRPSHQIGFTASDKAVTVSSTRLLVLSENGTSLAGLGEEWSAIVGNASVTDVDGLEHLRLRFDSLSQANDGDAVALTVLDADGGYAGDLRVLVDAQTVGFDMVVRTRDADGTILFEQPIASALQGTRAPYWVDLLDERLRLADVLARVGADYDLHLEEQLVDIGGGNADLAAERAISYVQREGSGAVTLGGTGDLRTGWSASYDGGTLLYSGHNVRYVGQDILVENGAVILAQDDGAVMAAEPFFEAELVGSVASITLSIPSLTGDEGAVSGGSTATVSTRAVRQAQLDAAAPDLSLSVTTDHPDLWATLWRDELSDVTGFTEGTHFVITEGSTSASLVVYGLTSTPGSTTNDLSVSLRQGDIEVEVEP